MSSTFVYKIWSGYDRFTPDKISDRLDAGGLLELGWKRYLDEVDSGMRVLVYFHGPKVPAPGVYLDGKVASVSREHRHVLLRPTRQSTTDPLTDQTMAEAIAGLVKPQGLQVFVLPEVLAAEATTFDCALDGDGSSCTSRWCDDCVVWAGLPKVQDSHFQTPNRLRMRSDEFDNLVAGYWIAPPRNYLGRRVGPEIRRTSSVLSALKMGDKSKAYPLALAMHNQPIIREDLAQCDAIVPIPLSPDKAKRGELHRTRLLGKELSLLTGIPVREYLTLTSPISKRTGGFSSPARFEEAYAARLEVALAASRAKSLLIVDDVITHGSTLAMAVLALRAVNPMVSITLATAGIMILKDTVLVEEALIA